MGQTRYFTVATAGHVDHGKTSLLRALTGIDPDRLKEEKERQMTTDLGFAYLRLSPDVMVGFVDVPGHGKFLKNMLAGVGGIDFALLVVSADEGPMPQSAQHAKILSLLGVKKVLLVISKTDIADALSIQGATRAAEALLEKYDLSPLAVVQVSSSKTGGVQLLAETLAEILKHMPERDTKGGAFLPIDRVFGKAGFGTVVTGTLVRGALATGDKVVIQPGAIEARIRRMEAHGATVAAAVSGQRLALNLAFKQTTQLSRGQVVLDALLPGTTSLLVSLYNLPVHEPVSADLAGAEIRLYHGTAEANGHIQWLTQFGDRADSCTIASIALRNEIVAEPGGLSIVRIGEELIYGGRILFLQRPHWLTRSRCPELARELADGRWGEALMQYLKLSPRHMAKRSALACFVPSAMIGPVTDKLLDSGNLCQLSALLLDAPYMRALSDRLLKGLSDPACSDGISQDKARTRYVPDLDRDAFDALVQSLIDADRIVRIKDTILLRGAAPREKPRDLSLLKEKVMAILQGSLCLEISEVARLALSSEQLVKDALAELAKEKRACVVNYQYAATSEALTKAHQTLAVVWQEKKDIAPGEFRDRLNTSRKYAMALLAHFDDNQVTRRLPAGRVLLKAPQP